MTVAAVTPIKPAREKKQRRAEVRDQRAQDRLTEALGKATTPGQVVAAGLDYLRVALAGMAKSDPATAMTTAWQIHDELKTHANQINARR